MTNLLDEVPRRWKWLAYFAAVAIVFTLFASIVQILGGIFGWS